MYMYTYRHVCVKCVKYYLYVIYKCYLLNLIVVIIWTGFSPKEFTYWYAL